MNSLARFHRQSAFTLLELLAAIAIVAVLAAIAIPSFDVLNNRRISQSQVENLKRALVLARQTAVTKNRTTVVCPSANGSTCQDRSAWSKGLLIYENFDADDGFNNNVDRLLEYIPGVTNVAGRHASSHLQHSLSSNKNRATFSAQGFTNDWQTFTYCDGNARQKFRITLIKTGRIKVTAGDDSSC